MELVEGEDLARRIARGPVPIDDAIPIARQIAEALEAAHEQGIIHRDLKPANVMVRPDGMVKILDFGLAKMVSGASGPDATVATMSSPTVLSPAMTQIGIILGTAAYMAPEQARGRAIDRRVDVWAFGCILFEMLSGTRPFDGETVTDVLSAIVSRDPDWTALPEQTSVEIRKLLHRCLEKDPRRRLRDIGEARLICENPHTGDVAGAPAAPARRPKWILPALGAALVIVSLIASALLVALRRPKTGAPSEVTQFDLRPPDNATLNIVFRPAVSVSADGSAIAFTAITEGVSRIYIRSRMNVDIHVVPGSDGGTNPSLSPDGKWVAFFVDGSIRKSSIDGPATTIGRAGDNRGIAWSDDGALIFPPQASGPLVRMSVDGGEQRPITTIGSGERTHRWPDVLPGGKAVLFTIGTLGSPDSYDASNIEAVLLATWRAPDRHQRRSHGSLLRRPPPRLLERTSTVCCSIRSRAPHDNRSSSSDRCRRRARFQDRCCALRLRRRWHAGVRTGIACRGPSPACLGRPTGTEDSRGTRARPLSGGAGVARWHPCGPPQGDDRRRRRLDV